MSKREIVGVRGTLTRCFGVVGRHFTAGGCGGQCQVNGVLAAVRVCACDSGAAITSPGPCGVHGCVSAGTAARWRADDDDACPVSGNPNRSRGSAFRCATETRCGRPIPKRRVGTSTMAAYSRYHTAHATRRGGDNAVLGE
jgi:hypothetical protein